MELFAARNVQFMIVARTEIASAARLVFTTFDELAVTSFTEPKYIDLLLSKHLSRTKIQITPNAVKVVWKVFQGNLLFTLNAAQEAYDVILSKNGTTIDDGIMAVASARQTDSLPYTEAPFALATEV